MCFAFPHAAIRRLSKQFKLILAHLVAAASTAVLLATSAQAALLGRNISGNAVAGSDASAVFLYDTDRNITWLKDANVNVLSWVIALATRPTSVISFSSNLSTGPAPISEAIPIERGIST